MTYSSSSRTQNEIMNLVGIKMSNGIMTEMQKPKHCSVRSDTTPVRIWTGRAEDRVQWRAGHCEHGNEPSASVTAG